MNIIASFPYSVVRTCAVPKPPRSPAQFHLPESRQLRGKQSLPAAMASDGYYDQGSKFD